MNINLLNMTLKKIKAGQWFKVKWTTDLPLTAEAKRRGFVAYKRTTATVRYGINYKNIASVKSRFQAKYQNGEIDTPPSEVKHELPWGQWKEGHEGVLIEHKGKDYLRVYTSPNPFKSEYFVNGEAITKEGIMTLGIVQSSYWKKPEYKPEALTVNITNIESMSHT